MAKTAPVPARAVPPGDGAREAGFGVRERAENFPVALWVLPPVLRRHLRAVYDVARAVDDLGDEAAGDRAKLLALFARDLALVWTTGKPQAAVLRRLVPTVRETGLGQEPFLRLVEANRHDQRVSSYASFDDLLGYCRLSADPVGRIVLQVLDAADDVSVALSDRVCTALQLLEHWQDVAEDRRAGRIYLPQADMAAYGVRPEDLDAPSSSPALRRLIAFETERAAQLLEQGTPLAGLLHGWGRVAVAGFVAGGRATIAALRRPGTDVLVATPRPRRKDLTIQLPRVLLGALT